MGVLLRTMEESATDALYAHPAFWVGVECFPIVLNPDRGSRRNLRGSGRRSSPVEIDQFRAAESGPGHIRRACRDCGCHLFLGAVVPCHAADAQVSVRLVV